MAAHRWHDVIGKSLHDDNEDIGCSFLEGCLIEQGIGILVAGADHVLKELGSFLVVHESVLGGKVFLMSDRLEEAEQRVHCRMVEECILAIPTA